MLVAPGLEQLSIGLVGSGPYGLRLTGGGHQQPLVVAKMHKRSKARAAGVEIGDILLSINGVNCRNWTVDRAMDFINTSTPDNTLQLHLLRGARDLSLVENVFDSLGQRNEGATTFNSFPRPSNSTQPIITTTQQQQQQQQHGTQHPVFYSSQLSTITAVSVPPTPFTEPSRPRHHISAMSFDRPVSVAQHQLAGGIQTSRWNSQRNLDLGDPYMNDGVGQSSTGSTAANSWNSSRLNTFDGKTLGSGQPSGPPGSNLWNTHQQPLADGLRELGGPQPLTVRPPSLIATGQSPADSWNTRQDSVGQPFVAGNFPAVPSTSEANKTWKPLMWRPSGALAAPSPLDVPRPVSAPPLRGASHHFINGTNDYDDYDDDDGNYQRDANDGGDFPRRGSHFEDCEEVIIWSSKVVHEPPLKQQNFYEKPQITPEFEGQNYLTPQPISNHQPPRNNFIQQQPPPSHPPPAPEPVSIPPTPHKFTWQPQSTGANVAGPGNATPTLVTATNVSGNTQSVESWPHDSMDQREESSSPPPFFLTRVVVGGDHTSSERMIDYEHKKKKMFADSSFYEDPEQKYPTIEEQIKMARQVARLLTSATNNNSHNNNKNNNITGRGQQMFLKRQQQSSQWTAESAPVIPQRRRPHSVPPEPPTRTPTSLEVLERLRLREAKMRHDVIPPSVFIRIADELKRTSTTGETTAGRKFARQRERAERSVVPEIPVARRNPPPSLQPPPQIPKPVQTQRGFRASQPPPELQLMNENFAQSQMEPVDDNFVPRLKRMIELQKPAMTPWEAAEKYDGHVDPAFDHIKAYRAASMWTVADPEDEEIKDLDAEFGMEQQRSAVTDTYLPSVPAGTQLRPQSANYFDRTPMNGQLPPQTQTQSHNNSYNNNNNNNNYNMMSTSLPSANPLGGSWSRASTPGNITGSRFDNRPPGGAATGFRSVQFRAAPY